MKYVPIKQEVTLTLTGIGYCAEELTEFSGKLGFLTRYAVRNPTGSSATAARFYLVPEATEAGAAAAPDELDVVYDTISAVAISTSDTALQLQDYFAAYTRAMVLPESKKKWFAMANITAGAGANTLIVVVEGFMLVK